LTLSKEKRQKYLKRTAIQDNHIQMKARMEKVEGEIAWPEKGQSDELSPTERKRGG